MSAPLLNSVWQIENRVKEQDKLLVFYFRGIEQKDGNGTKTLKRFMRLAKKKGFIAVQWNSNKSETVDYFDEKYGIVGKMGIVMYRDHKYLTSLRGIHTEEDEKFKLFEKVLNEYALWPVRPSPKEFAAARAKAEEKPKPKPKPPSKPTPKPEDDCCIIL